MREPGEVQRAGLGASPTSRRAWSPGDAPWGIPTEGFSSAQVHFPQEGPAPAPLTGGGLRLPGLAAWREALPWLVGAAAAGELGDGAVFLDVEATGLGGAGTIAFVIGAASVSASGVEVEQWVLHTMSGEGPMLAALGERLAALRAGGAPLVTFNGASYDLPLLRARSRRWGVSEAPLRGAHLDLLPVARRLWRGRGPDCRLATLEARELGLGRRGDIPGHAIPPVFWAALLRPHDAAAREQVRQVCAHNRADVLTTGALGLRLAEVIAAPSDADLAARAAAHRRALDRGKAR